MYVCMCVCVLSVCVCVCVYCIFSVRMCFFFGVISDFECPFVKCFCMCLGCMCLVCAECLCGQLVSG